MAALGFPHCHSDRVRPVKLTSRPLKVGMHHVWFFLRTHEGEGREGREEGEGGRGGCEGDRRVTQTSQTKLPNKFLFAANSIMSSLNRRKTGVWELGEAPSTPNSCLLNYTTVTHPRILDIIVQLFTHVVVAMQDICLHPRPKVFRGSVLFETQRPRRKNAVLVVMLSRPSFKVLDARFVPPFARSLHTSFHTCPLTMVLLRLLQNPLRANATHSSGLFNFFANDVMPRTPPWSATVFRNGSPRSAVPCGAR